jgi:hypothetical protein
VARVVIHCISTSIVKWQARASSILLQSHFANECKRAGVKVESTGEHRYATILKQKSFHLLGRSVDISRVLRQRMNQKFAKSLELAILRFVSQPFSW